MFFIRPLLRFLRRIGRYLKSIRQRLLLFVIVICVISIIATIVWKFHLLNILNPFIRKCMPLEDGIKSKVNIGIVTFQLNSSNSSKNGTSSKTRITGPISKQNHAAYANYHGYRIIREDAIPINPKLKEFGIVWAKVDVLRKHLRDFHWLLWIDSDVLIMNFKQRLEAFIPTSNDIDIIISSDRRGINAGIFLWRNSESGRAILERWAQLVSSDADEQEKLAFLIETEPNITKRTRIVPLCAFNSYLTSNTLTTRYEYGDFAVHFAGSAWKLQEEIQNVYGWNLFVHFSDLAGNDGITWKKWLSWRNILKLIDLPWRP